MHEDGGKEELDEDYLIEINIQSSANVGFYF